MTDTKPIRRIAVVGTGAIGASWTALFLGKRIAGCRNRYCAERGSLAEEVRGDRLAGPRSDWASRPERRTSNLKFTPAIAQAVERRRPGPGERSRAARFQAEALRSARRTAAADVIIASSSSGLRMSEIQLGAASHPERCVIGHPFNPPHLIPLVEIVGGVKTDEETIRRVVAFYRSIGKKTVRLNKELPGHVANRLQAALAREVYYLVAEDVLSAEDVDTALSWGPGLRWGIMGNMMLNHLGGGPGGIEHFFEQFAGPMTASWKALGSPELTPEVQKKLIESVHVEVGSRTIEELEAERDDILLGLLELRSRHPGTVTPPEVAG